MDILIHSHKVLSVESQPVEIVERKGLGHPDSICDALAEQVSVVLIIFDQVNSLKAHGENKSWFEGWGELTD